MLDLLGGGGGDRGVIRWRLGTGVVSTSGLSLSSSSTSASSRFRLLLLLASCCGSFFVAMPNGDDGTDNDDEGQDMMAGKADNKAIFSNGSWCLHLLGEENIMVVILSHDDKNNVRFVNSVWAVM